MAIHAPITTGAPVPLLGLSPLLAVPVYRRPTSFADALRQYRRATAAAQEASRQLRGRRGPAADVFEDIHSRRVSETLDAADLVLETAAGSVADLAAKIEVAIADGDWEHCAPLLLADARSLAVAR